MDYSQINVLNFRELGGYRSSDGRVVRHGVFYRGSAFHEIDLSSQSFINTLGIKHIVDLRSDEEATKKPVDFIPDGCDYVQMSANRLSHERRSYNLDFSDNTNDEAIENWLVQAYRYFPFANKAYQKVFDYIRREETPLYFHCAVGKDRTGTCAALILYLLDVTKEDIFTDYLRSYEHMLTRFKNPSRTSLVFREWLEGSFAEIEAKYKQRDDYFWHEFGISAPERQHLKDVYLTEGDKND